MKIILKKIFIFLLILIIGIMSIRLIFAYDMEKDTNTAGVLLTINDITITEQEFEEMVAKYYPDNLSDPALVEFALRYESMMSAKKMAS